MIRSLIKLAIFLLIGVLIYNYFFGTPEEKEQSRTVFRKAYDLGNDAWGVLRSEKAKFDDGKYDEAVDKVGGLLGTLRRTAERAQDSRALDRIAELEAKRQELEGKLNEDQPQSYSTEEKRQIREEWNELMRETETLMEEMEGSDGGQ